LSINLEAIKTVIQPTQIEAQNMLDHSLKTTRLGLDETRRVIKALRAGPGRFGIENGFAEPCLGCLGALFDTCLSELP